MPHAQASSSKDALQRLIDGLQTLIREHLALARAELKQDARVLGRDLMVGAAGVPALAAGYLLLMMAIGYLLAIWLPAWAAFAVVAAANLGVGAAVTYAGIRKMMSGRVELRRTGEELQRDKRWLASLKERPRVEGDVHPAAPRPAGEPIARAGDPMGPPARPP